MIKRLIFDVDNTIIEWKDRYLDAIKETVEEYKLDVDYLEINNLIEEYEKYYNRFEEDNLIELINKKMNIKVDKEFIEKWFERLAKLTESDVKIGETIRYLSKKYELVILSNWFKENQKERLKRANLLQYFKEVYCGDNILKPNEEAFKIAMNGRKAEECIMIGDNYKIDIEPSLSLEMKTIMITSKAIKEKDLICIKNVNELRKIL